MHISFPHPKYLLTILCFFLFLNKKITLISPTLLSVLLNVISKNISNAIQSSAHASVTTLDKCNNLNTNRSNCRYFTILHPNNAIVAILPHNIDTWNDILSFNLCPVNYHIHIIFIMKNKNLDSTMNQIYEFLSFQLKPVIQDYFLYVSHVKCISLHSCLRRCLKIGFIVFYFLSSNWRFNILPIHYISNEIHSSSLCVLIKLSNKSLVWYMKTQCAITHIHVI